MSSEDVQGNPLVGKKLNRHALIVVYKKAKERKAAKTEEIRSDLLVDFDDKNKLMGIEVLTVSQKLPQKALKSVNLEINLQQPKPLLTK
ncbi:hypothetical protein COW80_05410 [Candidatus Beckwithbacteria bacterium CG22_combo_CG10-13_8_21_14_all_01_47_9]|uniref:DUF2283 domain-containing protein n=1 Tax=Candidatus Beckwithbacteria bacterium CG22_combo_CG10-13_8_21_14_all_01_47_9 TaxID=1974496 RepID=A0A2H0DZ94_9BACT|nr:MAG: hypothetical protein COW80_05410 [Candidatus Beckwithbacteria bacterium CG22_combo_CG10-13_8_21_14_all_01_47_9]